MPATLHRRPLRRGHLSEFHLPNGLKLVLVPDDSKDVLVVNVTVLVGSRHEGYGEAGMAHLLHVATALILRAP